MTEKIYIKGVITGILIAIIYFTFLAFKISPLGLFDAILISFSAIGIGILVGFSFDISLKRKIWRVIPVAILTPVIYNIIQMFMGLEYSLYVFGENILVGAFLGGIIYLIFRFKKW
jgi:hypothetical protein